jgi:N-acyl-D-amino-acid deacylase
MIYDLVIRGGTVVDGSGLGGHRADVGVIGDRIAAVGRIREQGAVELDATGHVVTPGFIDGHTHMDAQVFWDPLGSSSCWHGVTTVVMGHCGFTLAPAAPDKRRLVVANLERAEDISPKALAAGIDWTWTTFGEYLDSVDALPKGINYVANVGHSALRTYVMGERAFAEVASEDDVRAMRTELRAALDAGAWGLTTSRTHHHMTSDDRPVASRVASWDEVRELVAELADAGVGMFQLTEDHPTPETQADYDRRVTDLAVETGVPMLIGATRGGAALRLLDDAAAAGATVTGLTHSRGVGALLSFRGHLPFDHFAEWQALRAVPEGKRIRALSDPHVRSGLIRVAKEGAYAEGVGAEARPPDYDMIFVMDGPVPPYRSLAEVAAERGTHPVGVMIDLAVESNLDQFFVQPFAPFDYDAVREAMAHPRTVLAFSDAGAHVSQISDCSIGTHLLAHWSRERGEFSLEEAVRMLTLEPARVWGLHDRGLVREGLVADLNVFDPQMVGPAMPYLDDDLPGGEPRIKQGAIGFLATVVAGQIVHERGEHTGALPGRLIRNRTHTGEPRAAAPTRMRATI